MIYSFGLIILVCRMTCYRKEREPLQHSPRCLRFNFKDMPIKKSLILLTLGYISI